MKLALVLVLLVACGDNLAPISYRVAWAQEGASDSPGVPGPVRCTTTISHPCPFLLYTTSLAIAADGSTLTWGDATGGVDLAGVTAEQHMPWVDPQTWGANGELVLVQRGDDGGLRHEAALAATPDGGWAGSVTWTLSTVAGNTTFRVTIR